MDHSDRICIKKVPGKGRGVFAKAPIRRGDVIERVPVLFVPVKDFVGGLENPTLKNYFYMWTDDKVAVSLGYGTLYNHSYKPNAKYEHGANTLTYRALRDIKEGEEVTINYNWVPTDKTPVGFDVK